MVFRDPHLNFVVLICTGMLLVSKIMLIFFILSVGRVLSFSIITQLFIYMYIS